MVSSNMKSERISPTLFLDTSVSNVKGISSNRLKVLSKLGVRTVRDMVTHFPRRYIDLSKVCKIADAKIGELCTIAGKIYEIKPKQIRRGLSLIEITLVDDTQTLIVTIFNQPWLTKRIQPGQSIAVAGKVEFDYGYKRMVNPVLEEIASNEIKGRVLAIHPATEKLSANMIRRLMSSALKSLLGVYDPIPLQYRVKRKMVSRFESYKNIHFPLTMDDLDRARYRLIYEEVLMLELFLMHEHFNSTKDLVAVRHKIDGKNLRSLAQHLPFTLTGDQAKAADELLAQMAKDGICNHMVLGDVGSGKTIIACFGIAAAKDSSGQSFFLAPTEVLAQQHYLSFTELFEPIGIRTALLTGSVPKDERDAILQDIATGEIDVLIGTHALLEDDVRPKNLTFAIIDEQQRFGVNQRATLLNKGNGPDALYLTATPIPRSLALAIFGNLSLSYIHEKPHSNTSRETFVCSRQNQGKAYDAAKDALKRGEQVYIVCPLVGAKKAAEGKKDDPPGDVKDSTYHPDVSIEEMEDFEIGNPSAAKERARYLQNNVFCDYRVEVLHGSMPSSDKGAIMQDFKDKKIDVLVTTTVIEVGVDVPNATTMIIEDADRFGLSQLHQLRGRVGRGEASAKVFLISSTKREEALKRLSALEKTDNGFALSEYDLSLRREGDILGNRQSGTTTLKLVNIMRDGAIIEQAHDDAKEIIERDPQLASFENLALKRELDIIFADEKEIHGG